MSGKREKKIRRSHLDANGTFHAETLEHLWNFVQEEANAPLYMEDLIGDVPITFDDPNRIRYFLNRAFQKLPKTDHNKMLIWILKARKGFFVDDLTGKRVCLSHKKIAEHFKVHTDIIKCLELEGIQRVKEAIDRQSEIDVPLPEDGIDERRIILPESM